MATHGEYKTPGGKLIAIDVNVRDQVLRDVVVTGDFFLYPEEALPRLAASLEGAPVTLTREEYAARVQAALDDGVELLGSSAEGLAIALERALEVSAAAGGEVRAD